MMIITFVVAAGEGNEIGANGNLLWHLPRDMQFFKETTLGHAVLMGRKTYESLPPKFRPLPGRTNIVLTRQQIALEGAIVVNDLTAAIKVAEQLGEKELMVIGGGEIYRCLFPFCNKICLTRVHARFPEADTFLPELNDVEWRLVSKAFHASDQKNSFDMDFIIYERNTCDGSV
ncbi:MAG: dihydrofolate reductase [Chitinophagales bacterium]